MLIVSLWLELKVPKDNTFPSLVITRKYLSTIETHLESSIISILYFILIIGTLLSEETIHKKYIYLCYGYSGWKLVRGTKLSCNNP